MKTDMKDIIYHENTRRHIRSKRLIFGLIGLFFFSLGVYLFFVFFMQLPIPAEPLRPWASLFALFFISIGTFFLIGVFSCGDLKIYTNGLTLPNKTIKQVFCLKENFIPFSEIKEIEIGEKLWGIIIQLTTGRRVGIDKECIDDFCKVKNLLQSLIGKKAKIIGGNKCAHNTQQ